MCQSKRAVHFLTPNLMESTEQEKLVSPSQLQQQPQTSFVKTQRIFQSKPNIISPVTVLVTKNTPCQSKPHQNLMEHRMCLATCIVTKPHLGKVCIFFTNTVSSQLSKIVASESALGCSKVSSGSEKRLHQIDQSECNIFCQNIYISNSNLNWYKDQPFSDWYINKPVDMPHK